MVCLRGLLASAMPNLLKAMPSTCADLDIQRVEYHDEVLTEMVQQIRTKLLTAEILVGLKKLALPNSDFASAKDLAQNALAAIQHGHLGYVVVTAVKSAATNL
jgi:hypothetical protein